MSDPSSQFLFLILLSIFLVVLLVVQSVLTKFFCKNIGGLWLEMAEILKNKCNVEIPISAQHIILGSDMLDYSINIFIVLIKYYIYSCRFSGQKQCVSSVVNILKRTDEISICVVHPFKVV
jgi:hypothetical protein